MCVSIDLKIEFTNKYLTKDLWDGIRILSLLRPLHFDFLLVLSIMIHTTIPPDCVLSIMIHTTIPRIVFCLSWFIHPSPGLCFVYHDSYIHPPDCVLSIMIHTTIPRIVFCLSWFIQPSPGLCFDTVPALYNVSQTVHVYHDLTFRPVSLKSLGNNNVWYGNWNMLKKTSNAILTLVCLFRLQHFTILSHLFNH
jgi:hypothetical protein